MCVWYTSITTCRNIEKARTSWVFCRMHYHLATPGVAAAARAASVFKAQRFSDHAPLIVDYDWGL